MGEDGPLVFFFPLFSLVLVLPGNIQTREKAVSAPGTWPPRDAWTPLWEDWYILEIAETPFSVRSISKRGRGGLSGRRKLPPHRGAASEPGPQTDSQEDAGPQRP